MEERSADHAAERRNKDEQRTPLQTLARTWRNKKRCREEKKV
jgi:hypothetical protein